MTQKGKKFAKAIKTLSAFYKPLLAFCVYGSSLYFICPKVHSKKHDNFKSSQQQKSIFIDDT
jgi:hypothetical protein